MSKKQSRKGPVDESGIYSDIRHLLDAMGGESPLACVLICGAQLDRWLLEVLKAAMKKGNTAESLLNEKGLLGSFYHRAQIAYVFGLIDSTILFNLQTIAEIRNQFAHSPTPLAFETESIENLCAQLRDMKGGISVGGLSKLTAVLTPKMPPGARGRFVSTSFVTVWALSSLAKVVRRPQEVLLRSSEE